GDGILGISSNGYAGHFIGNINTEGNAYVSGSVGIGTENPITKLEVDNGDILVKGVDNFTSPGKQAILYIGDENHSIRAEYASGLIFGTWAAPNAIVVKDSTGNVGLGTTTPAGRLDVNGSIYQRGGVLHADYVFEPDYKLETIEKHSEFMWHNKHLSAIPKATVDENGREIVEIGARSKGVVEELEKAHIYIEQLHDRNKVLEERLAKLEAAVAQMNILPQGEIE
ncbi:MAG: hypothetical protein L0Y36_00765, partial [Planctomycetales bacterium]|nr:hypothetical protein [Planctomycetales bacterium]